MIRWIALPLFCTTAVAQPAVNPTRCAPVAIVKQVYAGDYVIELDGLQAQRTRAWWRSIYPENGPDETLILVKRVDGLFVLHFGPPALVCSGIVLMPERAMELLAILQGAEA